MLVQFTISQKNSGLCKLYFNWCKTRYFNTELNALKFFDVEMYSGGSQIPFCSGWLFLSEVCDIFIFFFFFIMALFFIFLFLLG